MAQEVSRYYRSMLWMVRIFTLVGIVLAASSAWSQVEHKLLRRLVVFPIKADKAVSSQAEEAWWQVRELLTQNKRFLVASKNFLVKKDVFQARGELTPADAIILGQLLDAQALVTTFLDDRTLLMKVYEGEYGRLLWQQEIKLHTSLTVAQQIAPASRKLILDFMSSVPYQGFVIVDNLIGQPVYQQENRWYFKADVGSSSQAQVGDEVQVVKIISDRLKPLFDDGANIEVFAEGRVVGKDREFVTVEILRTTDQKLISESSLIRLPKEYKRLRESFAINDSLTRKINPEYFSPEMTPLTQEAREYQPLAAALSFIANIAIFLVLAF